MDANVVGLVLGKGREVGAQLAKVERGDLLVELLGQQVDLVAVLGLGLSRRDSDTRETMEKAASKIRL